jgi:hypothetical protein
MHVGAFSQYHSGAEETDAGHDLRGDSRGIAFTDHGGKNDEAAGTERNEGIRAQARYLLVPLPLNTDG